MPVSHVRRHFFLPVFAIGEYHRGGKGISNNFADRTWNEYVIILFQDEEDRI